MSSLRLFVAALVLIGGIFATHSLRPPDAPQAHRPLREFPAAIALWHSEDLPFETQVVQEIGVDDYTNREYFGGGHPIELYIGYYKDQRSGEAIHSPKNCLPGAGWEPVRSALLQIGSADKPVLVNEYIVEKGTSRELVLYWYQTHGRIVASEYWAKFWLVADGVRHRGTDGAMIRIWTTAADGEESAQARAADFARRIYPQVAEFLPN
jgi:EpsI family protein